MTDYERGYRDGREAAAKVADSRAATYRATKAIVLSEYTAGRNAAAADIVDAIRAMPVPQGGEATEDATAEVDPVAFEHWWHTRQPPNLRAMAIDAGLITVSGGMLYLTPTGLKLRRRGEALRARSQP